MASPTDLLLPGGTPIGTPGSSPDIREVGGGLAAATQLFDDLTQSGNDVTPAGYPGKLVELPAGGFIGLRPALTSGPPTLDVNVPGVPIRKVKFK